MTSRHICISLFIAMTLGSCGKGESADKDHLSLMEASRAEMLEAIQDRDSLLALVSEIARDMERIDELEHLLGKDAGDLDAGSRETILARVSAVRQSMWRRRERLQALEGKLRQSARRNVAMDADLREALSRGMDLQATIDLLRSQIDRRMAEADGLRKRLSSAKAHIGSLNDEVAVLNTAVREVTIQRDEAVVTSARLEDELNACYYVAAPGSELKAHDILESGFLRKTRLMRGDFDQDVFVAADKRSLACLSLGTRKAKVLTNHPVSSYRLVERDGNVSLCIVDPERFWSLGNYLVVQTD